MKSKMKPREIVLIRDMLLDLLQHRDTKKFIPKIARAELAIIIGTIDWSLGIKSPLTDRIIDSIEKAFMSNTILAHLDNLRPEDITCEISIKIPKRKKTLDIKSQSATPLVQ